MLIYLFILICLFNTVRSDSYNLIDVLGQSCTTTIPPFTDADCTKSKFMYDDGSNGYKYACKAKDTEYAYDEVTYSGTNIIGTDYIGVFGTFASGGVAPANYSLVFKTGNPAADTYATGIDIIDINTPTNNNKYVLNIPLYGPDDTTPTKLTRSTEWKAFVDLRRYSVNGAQTNEPTNYIKSGNLYYELNK